MLTINFHSLGTQIEFIRRPEHYGGLEHMVMAGSPDPQFSAAKNRDIEIGERMRLRRMTAKSGNEGIDASVVACLTDEQLVFTVATAEQEKVSHVTASGEELVRGASGFSFRPSGNGSQFVDLVCESGWTARVRTVWLSDDWLKFIRLPGVRDRRTFMSMAHQVARSVIQERANVKRHPAILSDGSFPVGLDLGQYGGGTGQTLPDLAAVFAA